MLSPLAKIQLKANAARAATTHHRASHSSQLATALPTFFLRFPFLFFELCAEEKAIERDETSCNCTTRAASDPSLSCATRAGIPSAFAPPSCDTLPQGRCAASKLRCEMKVPNHAFQTESQLSSSPFFLSIRIPLTVPCIVWPPSVMSHPVSSTGERGIL